MSELSGSESKVEESLAAEFVSNVRKELLKLPKPRYEENLLANKFLLWFPLDMLFGALSSAYRGWVLAYMWAWFLAPVYGIAAPPALVLGGVGLMLRLAVFPVRAKLDEQDRDLTHCGYAFGILIASMMQSSMALLVAWLIKLCM